MAKKSKKKSIIGLVALLIVVVAGSTLFVMAAAGWFSAPKMVLDESFRGEFVDYDTLSAEGYEGLVNEKASFVVFIDQTGCNTAEHLREYTTNWAVEHQVKVHRIMYSDMKETSLGQVVKYYPSVALISKGKVMAFLRADSDEDADAYNNYDAFKDWINQYF